MFAAGQRYRILYRLEEREVVVLAVGLGLRKQGSGKGIYQLARKLLELRLV